MFVDFCVHCLCNRRINGIINVLMMMMKIHTKKYVSGPDPVTAARMHTVSTVSQLTDVDSSMRIASFLPLEIMSAISFRRISVATWLMISAHKWSECSTLPTSMPLSCCSSMSAGKSLYGRSFFAILYADLNTRQVVSLTSLLCLAVASCRLFLADDASIFSAARCARVLLWSNIFLRRACNLSLWLLPKGSMLHATHSLESFTPCDCSIFNVPTFWQTLQPSFPPAQTNHGYSVHFCTNCSFVQHGGQLLSGSFCPGWGSSIAQKKINVFIPLDV